MKAPKCGEHIFTLKHHCTLRQGWHTQPQTMAYQGIQCHTLAHMYTEKSTQKKTQDTSTKNFVCMCAWVLGSTRIQIMRTYLHGHIVIKFMPPSIISQKENLPKANSLNHIDVQTFVNETISSMHASALKNTQTKRYSSRLIIVNDNQQTKHTVQNRNLESPPKRL